MSEPYQQAEEFLRSAMVEIGHYSYLACYAADRLSVDSPEVISNAVPKCVRRLCRDPDSLYGGNDDIELDKVSVSKRIPGMQTWVIQSLLIRLDALLHAVLDILNVRDLEADSQPIESDICRVLPPVKREYLSWAYKDVVLLAVYRNCVVHGNGALPIGRAKRLIDAGWEPNLWLDRIDWGDPRFDDFLRLKKAVRSIASACIQSVRDASTDKIIGADPTAKRRP